MNLNLIDSFQRCYIKTGYILTGSFVMLLIFILQGCTQPDQDNILEDSAVYEHMAEPETDQVSESGEDSSVEEVSYPPITTLPAEDLAELLAAAQENNQAVVINFWATWCPPCLAEMPYFIRFYEEYDRDKVLFLSITADHIDTLDSAVRPYQRQENLPFPIYVLVGMDPAPYSENIGFELSGALPVTLVYDSNGELVQSWEREIKYEELDEVVSPLIS